MPRATRRLPPSDAAQRRAASRGRSRHESPADHRSQEGQAAGQGDGSGDRACPCPVREDPHGLISLERADDERPAGAARHLDRAIGADDRHAENPGVLDGGELLDPKPDGRLRRQARREPVGDLGGGADRLPDQRHEAVIECFGVDACLVDAFAEAKRDR